MRLALLVEACGVWLSRLARPFVFTVPDAAALRWTHQVVEGVRIAFGLLLGHRALDMAGFAVMADDPGAFAARALLEAALSLAIAAGLLTPLALGLHLLLLAVFPQGDYLALQVVRMLALGLLLAGAGRRASLDAILARRLVIERLYFLDAGSLAYARLLLVALFGSLTFFSLRYHAADTLWRQGHTLQVALLTPYFSPAYEGFGAMARGAPRLFDLLLTAGLLVQAVWQMAFLPLFFLPVALPRRFAVLQALLFFLASTLFLNLAYLGPFELLFWALVFGSDRRLGLGERTPAAAPAPLHRAPAALLGAGLLATALFAASAGLSFVDLMAGTSLEKGLRWCEPLVRPFGLRRADVFNRADIQAGATVLLLLETDAAGRPMRTVPLMDRFGGRLDWLRNDHLYSFFSLPWQRARREAQFVRSNPEHLSARTLDFLRRLVDLDLCLSDFAAPRYYRAEISTRALVLGEPFPRWTDPQPAATVRLAAGPPRAERVRSRLRGAAGLLGCYDLPPGHAGGARRGAEALAWARKPGP